MYGTSMLTSILKYLIKLLSDRIRISLHKMFATFHHEIGEYSTEKSNMICRSE